MNWIEKYYLDVIALLVALGALFGFVAFGQVPMPDAGGYPSVTFYLNPCGYGIGQRVYFGGGSGAYTNMVDAGMSTQLTVSNLPEGFAFYFAATTYTAAGAESAISKEIVWTNYGTAVLSNVVAIRQGTNLLLTLINPTGANFYRMSNGWLRATARFNPADWLQISHFNFTSAAPLRITAQTFTKVIP